MKGKRALSALLGTVLALVILEGTLRLVARRDLAARSELPGREDALIARPLRILVLGNSYTAGAGAEPGESYPSQLQRLLDARLPGQAAVFNRGRVNTNTRHILETLDADLAHYDPRIVVVMTGQANHWNAYGYSDYLRETGRGRPLGLRVHDLLEPLRVFRLAAVLADVLAGKGANAGGAASLAFPDVPLSRTSELEARWIASTKNRRWCLDLSEAQAAEGVRVLERAVKEKPNRPDAYTSLARLFSTRLRREAEALALHRRALALRPGRFSASSYLSLRQMAQNPRVAQLPGYRDTLREAERGEPRGEERARLLAWVGGEKLPYDDFRPEGAERNLRFLERVTTWQPGYAPTYIALVVRYIHRKKDYAAAVNTILRALRSSPGQAQFGYAAFLSDAVNLSGSPELRREAEAFRSWYAAEFPSLAWQIAAVDGSDELKWVGYDFARIAAAVRAHGSSLVLQTYPPHRHSDEGWAADGVIRSFAGKDGTIVSDTGARLREKFREAGDKEGYYSFRAGSLDEHLNGRGYALVAGILLDTLVAEKLAP